MELVYSKPSDKNLRALLVKSMKESGLEKWVGNIEENDFKLSIRNDGRWIFKHLLSIYQEEISLIPSGLFLHAKNDSEIQYIIESIHSATKLFNEQINRDNVPESMGFYTRLLSTARNMFSSIFDNIYYSLEESYLYVFEGDLTIRIQMMHVDIVSDNDEDKYSIEFGPKQNITIFLLNEPELNDSELLKVSLDSLATILEKRELWQAVEQLKLTQLFSDSSDMTSPFSVESTKKVYEKVYGDSHKANIARATEYIYEDTYVKNNYGFFKAENMSIPLDLNETKEKIFKESISWRHSFE